MRTIIKTVFILVFVLSSLTNAFAERKPKPGRHDNRVRTVVYREDDVYRVTASYGISLMITFGINEVIETITIGDSKAWAVRPNKGKNIVFIKPTLRNAGTNLNIITNKRKYIFDIDATAGLPKNKVIYQVKFIYPNEKVNAAILEQARKNVRNKNLNNLDVANINSEYSYRGNKKSRIKPAVIFDDGVKTFFKFKGKTPAIFMVDAGRNETLVNVRREAEFIVVDGTNRQWTLRNGNDTICVYNLNSERASPVPSADSFVKPKSKAKKFWEK